MYCDIEVRILGLTFEIMRNYEMKIKIQKINSENS